SAYGPTRRIPTHPTRRSSDLAVITSAFGCGEFGQEATDAGVDVVADQAHPLDAVNAAFGGLIGNPGFDRASHGLDRFDFGFVARPEAHTSELQSRFDLVCRLL